MIEKIGICSTFQIQCVHEPFAESDKHVFGRMCLRFGEDVLGDFDEPACMLNVTAAHFEKALHHLAEQDEPELIALSDEQLWDRLDSALYGGDNLTMEQIIADSRRYCRFNFLTNGGESFDHSKSFFVGSAHEVRVLFKHGDQPLVGRRVERAVFIQTLQTWLRWLDHQAAGRQ